MCNWLLERHTGKPFAGMPGPNITGDGWTTDLMADVGMRYRAVWVYDERPSPPLTKTGARLVALPYSYEFNDAPLLMRSHMEGADYAERCIAHFDWLYEEADSDGRSEPVAAVVGEDAAVTEEAASLIEVEYEHRAAVCDLDEARGAQAPRLFKTIPMRNPAFVDVILRAGYEKNTCNTFTVSKGDVAEGFSRADHVLYGVFENPAAGVVPLEARVVVADSRPDRITVWSSTQPPHVVRHQLGPGVSNVGPVGGPDGGRGHSRFCQRPGGGVAPRGIGISPEVSTLQALVGPSAGEPGEDRSPNPRV